MRKIIFYPILFSINPMLLLLAANVSDVSISQLFPVIVIAPIGALVLLWLLNKWLKDIHRAGFIVFLTIFWFFHYGTVHLWANAIHIGPVYLGNQWLFLPLWTIIFLFLMSGLLWRKVTSPETITLFLNLACLAIVCFSIIRISLDVIPRYLTRSEVTQAVQAVPKLPADMVKPDVYYIILDGYARQDVLNELYHYDNSGFINELGDRGFFVSTTSQSNYMQTALSVASSLNMEYLSGLSKLVPDRGQLIGLIQHNKSMAIFKKLGYKIITFASGYQPTDVTNTDIHLSSPRIGKSHDLEALMLINSVANFLIEQGWINVPITRYSTAQERINYEFDSLGSEVPGIEGPKMVFAHIIAPHAPFIFDQNGPIPSDNFYVLQDGNNFWGTQEQYIHDYVEQLIYTNKQVIKMIDGILTKSKTPPIIILQADHGPGAYLNFKSVENTCLKERFSILNAYYLPPEGKAEISDDFTPVNAFRFVLSSYFGIDYELLPNKQYYSTWDMTYNFTDVTDESQMTCKVP